MVRATDSYRGIISLHWVRILPEHLFYVRVFFATKFFLHLKITLQARMSALQLHNIVQAFIGICLPLLRTPIQIGYRQGPLHPNQTIATLNLSALTEPEKEYVRSKAAIFFSKNTAVITLFMADNAIMFGSTTPAN